ncbi:MAG TPA: hypothetical protein ENF23_04245 [Methanosarcinales archaeon]|nr:hypothetical protein [Methanosarcinales archaeon]
MHRSCIQFIDRGRGVIALKYEVVNIRELPSAKIFENRFYGLYPLTPLMADSDLAGMTSGAWRWLRRCSRIHE